MTAARPLRIMSVSGSHWPIGESPTAPAHPAPTRQPAATNGTHTNVSTTGTGDDWQVRQWDALAALERLQEYEQVAAGTSGENRRAVVLLAMDVFTGRRGIDRERLRLPLAGSSSFLDVCISITRLVQPLSARELETLATLQQDPGDLTVSELVDAAVALS